jgi:hypothetical protein
VWRRKEEIGREKWMEQIVGKRLGESDRVSSEKRKGLVWLGE